VPRLCMRVCACVHVCMCVYVCVYVCVCVSVVVLGAAPPECKVGTGPHHRTGKPALHGEAVALQEAHLPDLCSACPCPHSSPAGGGSYARHAAGGAPCAADAGEQQRHGQGEGGVGEVRGPGSGELTCGRYLAYNPSI